MRENKRRNHFLSVAPAEVVVVVVSLFAFWVWRPFCTSLLFPLLLLPYSSPNPGTIRVLYASNASLFSFLALRSGPRDKKRGITFMASFAHFLPILADAANT